MTLGDQVKNLIDGAFSGTLLTGLALAVDVTVGATPVKALVEDLGLTESGDEEGLVERGAFRVIVLAAALTGEPARGATLTIGARTFRVIDVETRYLAGAAYEYALTAKR